MAIPSYTQTVPQPTQNTVSLKLFLKPYEKPPTIVSQAVQATAVHMYTPPSLEIKVNNLVQDMLNSGIFNSEQQKRINIWKSRLLTEFCLDLSKEYQKAALSVCYLLFKLIKPEINKRLQDDLSDEMNCLFDLQDDTEDLLSDILPKNDDVQLFLKGNAKLFEEKMSLEEKLKILEDTFQHESKQLCEAANTTIFERKKAFEVLKKRILEIYEQKSELKSDFEQRVDTLTQKVLHACKRLETVTQEMLQTGKLMEANQCAYQQLISQGEALK